MCSRLWWRRWSPAQTRPTSWWSAASTRARWAARQHQRADLDLGEWGAIDDLYLGEWGAIDDLYLGEWGAIGLFLLFLCMYGSAPLQTFFHSRHAGYFVIVPTFSNIELIFSWHTLFILRIDKGSCSVICTLSVGLCISLSLYVPNMYYALDLFISYMSLHLITPVRQMGNNKSKKYFTIIFLTRISQ